MAARRFLAPQGRSADGRGYYNRPQRPITSAIADDAGTVERIAAATAMCDEPEAPSAHWINPRAELAAEHNRLRLLKQAEEALRIRGELPIQARIQDAKRLAKARRVDLSSEFFLMRKQLARGKLEHVHRILSGIEVRLQGVDEVESAA